MPAEWFVTRKGVRSGPFSPKGLRKQAVAGLLQPDDLVWKEGLSDWISARALRGLFSTKAPLVPAAEPTRDDEEMIRRAFVFDVPSNGQSGLNHVTSTTSNQNRQSTSFSASEMTGRIPFARWYGQKTAIFSSLPRPLSIVIHIGLWVLQGYLWIPVWYLNTRKSDGDWPSKPRWLGIVLCFGVAVSFVVTAVQGKELEKMVQVYEGRQFGRDLWGRIRLDRLEERYRDVPIMRHLPPFERGLCVVTAVTFLFCTYLCWKHDNTLLPRNDTTGRESLVGAGVGNAVTNKSRSASPILFAGSIGALCAVAGLGWYVVSAIIPTSSQVAAEHVGMGLSENRVMGEGTRIGRFEDSMLKIANREVTKVSGDNGERHYLIGATVVAVRGPQDNITRVLVRTPTDRLASDDDARLTHLVVVSHLLTSVFNPDRQDGKIDHVIKWMSTELETFVNRAKKPHRAEKVVGRFVVVLNVDTGKNELQIVPRK